MSISPTDGSYSSTEVYSDKVRAAEREANSRVISATRRVQDAEIEGETLLEHQRKENADRLDTESARQEGQLQEMRDKGYSQIRELQRAQQAEMRRVRLEGEEDLSQLTQHYQTAVRNSSRRGSEELQQVQGQTTQNLEHERRQGEAQTQDLIENRNAQIATLREEAQSRLEELKRSQEAQLEKTKTGYQQATERSTENLQTKYQEILTANDDATNRVYDRANRKLQEIRQDTATKLAAYAQRQQDPFYSPIELSAEFNDDGDSYSVFIPVPDYEKHHLSAALQGDSLVISGYRSSQDEGQREGRTLSTSTYQAFHEKFPLDWPVREKSLSKEIRPDGIQFRVFKKGEFAKKAPTNKPNPEPPQKNRPIFPKGLSEPIHISVDRSILDKAPGSGTLT